MKTAQAAQIATIQDVYRLCGWPAVQKLVDVARGRQFTIPSHEFPEGLRRSLGPVAAMRLRQRIGGGVIVNVPADTGELRALRDREVRAAQRVHGLSIPELVSEFGLSEWQVRDALSGGYQPRAFAEGN